MSVVPPIITPRAGRLMLCINGILTEKSSHNWNANAARIAQRAGLWGDCYQYTTDIFTKDLRKDAYVGEVLGMLADWNAAEVHLVTHSFGGWIACEVLRRGFRLASIHLIQAAIDPDCDVNGINEALDAGRLKEAWFYCSQGDEILSKLAPLSRLLPMVPDFGSAGYTGPRHFRAGVHSHFWPMSYGHSTATEPQHLGETMALVLQNIEALAHA